MADATSSDETGDTTKKASCGSWFANFVFSCCFAGFLNPNGSGSKEYYTTLGVSKHAKLAEIKKAYKKLSLQFHPDKLRQRGEVLTEEMQENFRKIKQAYEVLSDPEKRKLYDTLGINGIMLRDDPGMFMQNPTLLKELVSKADMRAWCLVMSVITLIFGFLFFFPLLFALQIDGDIDISFSAVFAPVWIADLIIWFVVISEVVRGKSVRPEGLSEGEDWFDDNPLINRQIGLVAFTLFVLFQVILVAKLDGAFHGIDWVTVMIPYYLFELAECCSQWLASKSCEEHALHKEAKAAEKEAAQGEGGEDNDDDDEMMEKSMGLKMAAEELRCQAKLYESSVYYHTYRLVQVFVIILQVDEVFGDSASWWLVLIPTIMYATVNCGNFGKTHQQLNVESAKLAAMAEAPPPESMKEHMENELKRKKLTTKLEFLFSFSVNQACSGCCLTLYLLILGFFLTNTGDDRFSFFWFYFPLGVLIFCPLCCLCCASCCEMCIGEEEEEEGEEIDTSGIDPVELEAAMQEAGMLDGEVDAEMMQALVDSMREAMKKKKEEEGGRSDPDELSSVNNPISSDDESNANKQYACPDCGEVFGEWESCLSHFAITSHADYGDDTDKEALKKQCCQEIASSPQPPSSTSATASAISSLPMNVQEDTTPALVTQVEESAEVVEDANIDDID